MAESRQDTELQDQYIDVSWLRTPASTAISPPQLPWSAVQSPPEALGFPPVLPATIIARGGHSTKASAYATPTFVSHHPGKKPTRARSGIQHAAVSASPENPAVPVTSVPYTLSPSPTRVGEGAQRYRGFPGVPAYVLAPDVIVFNPRKTVSPSGKPLTKEPPSDSPADGHSPIAEYKPMGVGPAVELQQPELDISSEEQVVARVGDRLWFKQAWAICVAAVGTFIMPVGLMILAYLNTPSTARSTARTLPSPILSLPTLPSPKGTRSWPSLPSKCTEAPRLDGTITNIHFEPTLRFNVEPDNTIFCVYNVTRFKPLFDPLLQPYAPRNMPLEYCRSVVYWSMAVGADKIESRAQDFDDVYGVAVLRQLITSSLLKKPKTLLLALGGYQSDSVHLTKIARHQRQLTSFTKSVLDMVVRHGMDGVAVHWVPPEAACRVAGRDDDLLTLSTIVDAISKAFTSNTVSKMYITLLLPADHAATNPLVNVLVNVVDYVIVQTHLLQLPLVPSGKLCTDVAKNTTDFIHSLSLSPEQEKKVCSGFSLSPYKVVASPIVGQGVHNFSYDSDSKLDGLRGRGRVSDACGNKIEPCRYALLFSDCIVVYPNAAQQHLYYMFHKADTVQSIVSHVTSQARQRIAADHCAALFDLDMDNWDDRITCAGFDLPYRYLTHFHSSIEGRASPLQMLRRC